MIRTECDICRKKYRFEGDFEGSVVRCRECRAEFEVPVRSLWERFEEANPDLAHSTKWVLRGSVVAVVLIGLTIGGYELKVSMGRDNPDSPGVVPPPVAGTQPATGHTSTATPVGQGTSPKVDRSDVSLDDILGTSPQSEMQAVAMPADASGLFSAHGSREIRLNGLPGLELVDSLGLAPGRVTDMLVTSDGRTLIVATQNGEVVTFDTKQGTRLKVYTPHSSPGSLRERPRKY